jgi:hypothetical protein
MTFPDHRRDACIQARVAWPGKRPRQMSARAEPHSPPLSATIVAASWTRMPRTRREQIGPADADGKLLPPRRNLPSLRTLFTDFRVSIPGSRLQRAGPATCVSFHTTAMIGSAGRDLKAELIRDPATARFLGQTLHQAPGGA